MQSRPCFCDRDLAWPRTLLVIEQSMVPPSSSAFNTLLRQQFVSLWLARPGLHRSAAVRIQPALSQTRTPRRAFTWQGRSTHSSPTAITPTTSPTTTPVPKQARKKTRQPWTPEADASLLEMRTVQNLKWFEIGQHLGREPATCMTRFESALNPDLKSFWTPTTEAQLDTMMTQAKSWLEISQALGIHRLACMEKWRQMGMEVLDTMDSASLTMARRKRGKAGSSPSPLLDNGQDLEGGSPTMVQFLSKDQVDKDQDRESWNALLHDSQRYQHYRSWKAKGKLLDTFSQLYLINPGWSAKEETILVQHVLQNGLDSWGESSAALNGKFSPEECRTCWKNLDMPVVGSASATSSPQSSQPATVHGKEAQGKPATAAPFVWDKESSVRLQAVIRQAYRSQAVHLDDINWPWVSKRVHPKATARLCKNHWKFLHDPSASLSPSLDSVSVAAWSHEDDKKLEGGIRLLGPKRLAAVREYFLSHRTKDEVIRHWFKISDRAAMINEHEYYTLLQIVRTQLDDHLSSSQPSDAIIREGGDSHPIDSCPIDWGSVEKAMVSQGLVGWKKAPCRRIWESSFQYLIQQRGKEWTPALDNTLLRMVKFVGRDDWYSVSKAIQGDFSPWQCRIRWCQLLDPVTLDQEDLTVKGEKYC